jgi:hypothetical protein
MSDLPNGIRLLLACCLLGLALSGCGEAQVYPGPAQPLIETALLRGSVESFPTYYAHTTILKVDDQEISWSKRNNVRILPGRHKALLLVSPVHLQLDLPKHREEVGFLVKAGCEYTAKSELGIDRWYVWIEDSLTGELAGGSKPTGANGQRPPTKPP